MGSESADDVFCAHCDRPFIATYEKGDNGKPVEFMVCPDVAEYLETLQEIADLIDAAPNQETAFALADEWEGFWEEWKARYRDPSSHLASEAQSL